MDGSQHKMPRQRGLDGNVGGFAVTDFADHHNVRVLPQYCTQTSGKCHAYFCIHLRLADAFDGIFHWVFNREDIARAVIQPFQASI